MKLAHTITERPDGCWEWGGVHNRGYAQTSGRPFGQLSPIRVHRLLWIEKNGPVPDGLVLDHFYCDQPWCVNPDHVRPVTVRENTLRSKKNAFLTPEMKCPKGHDLNETLGTRPDGGPKCLACMADYQRAYVERKRSNA